MRLLSQSDDLQRVPAQLRALRQFVVYRLEDRNGKTTKVPYSARSGRRASTTNREDWVGFDEALAVAREDPSLDGTGFVFANDDGLAGIDLDHCRDPARGTLDDWAQRIVSFFDSYTELSPSGTGVHIFVAGVLTGAGRKHPQIEVYDRGRYFTITGRHLPGTPTDVRSRQEQLDELHGLLGGSPQPAHGADASSSRVDLAARMELAFGSRNGDKLRRLLDGDDSAYGGDASAGDMAAASILAWYLDNDEQAIDAAVRSSARYRPKWDERHYGDGETYGQHTISEAIGLTGGDCYGAGRRHYETAADAHPPRVQPAFNALGVDEWLSLADDPADIVIGDGGDGFVLSIDGKGAIAGGPGIGKTNLLLRLGRCLAEGQPFLKLPVPQPRGVLYVAVEGSRRGIKKRLAKVWDGASQEARARFRLALVQVDLLAEDGRLDELLDRHQPEVMIIDPLRNAHTLDENSSQDVARLITRLDDVIERHHCAVILAHHGRKEHPLAKGEPGIDNVRGSTALTGWLSFVLTVRRKPKVEDIMLADWVKVRDAEEALPALELEFVRSRIDFKVEARRADTDLAETIKNIVFQAGTIRMPDLLPKVQELVKCGEKAIRTATAALVRTGVLIKGRMDGDKADSFRLANQPGEAAEEYSDDDE